MGGWDSKKYLDHLEVFDTRAGRWRSAPHMATPRAYGSAAVLNDQIYIIGGLSGSVSAHAPSICSHLYWPLLHTLDQLTMPSLSAQFHGQIVRLWFHYSPG